MPMSIPARLRAFGISKVLDCLDRDPDNNLPRLMEWVDKYAGEKLPLPYRDLLHRAMTDPNNNWNQLIRSLYTDIDSRVLKKIFENFIIYGGPASPTREQLLDLHRRIQAFRKTKPLLTLDFWDGPSLSEAAPQGGTV